MTVLSIGYFFQDGGYIRIGQIVGPALVAAALSEHIAAAFIASAIALAIAMALTLIGVLAGNVDR